MISISKYIVLFILIIIAVIFILNYDIYIVLKNEEICKPIYIMRSTLLDEIEYGTIPTNSEQNNLMNVITGDELFHDLLDKNNLENFEMSNSELYVPSEALSNFKVPEVTNYKKSIVINNTIGVLSNIPTKYSIEEIEEMIEYFAIIYQTSSNLDIFYKNIASSVKIKSSPYNTKYSQLILYLIGKFDDDFENCENIKTEADYETEQDCLNSLNKSEQHLNKSEQPGLNTNEQYLNKSEQPRLNTNEQPRLNTNEQPIVNTNEQPRVNTNILSRLNTNEQPRLNTNEQPRLNTNEQSRLNTNEQPRLNANEQPRLNANEQPRLNANEQPRVNTNILPRANTNEQPRVNTNEQPRLNANEQPRLNANEQPRVNTNEQSGLNANEQPSIFKKKCNNKCYIKCKYPMSQLHKSAESFDNIDAYESSSISSFASI